MDKGGGEPVRRLSGFEAHIAKRQGLLGKYVSPESAAYRKGFRDPEGYWTDIWDNYYVIGYNTTLVKKGEAPRTWQDLLDPRWKGKLGMDIEEFEWYKGHNLLAQLLAAGEFPLAISYAHRIEQQKKKGAPVDWVTTSDPIIVALHPTGIGARPLHENAAKLFIDFTLSREGQRLIRSFHRTPARLDLDQPTPQMDPRTLPLYPLAPAVGERYKKYVEEFIAIFSPTGS